MKPERLKPTYLNLTEEEAYNTISNILQGDTTLTIHGITNDHCVNLARTCARHLSAINPDPKIYRQIDSFSADIRIYARHGLLNIPKGVYWEEEGIYWNERANSFCLVHRDTGEFMTERRQRVAILSVHATGEIRWEVTKRHLENTENSEQILRAFKLTPVPSWWQE